MISLSILQGKTEKDYGHLPVTGYFDVARKNSTGDREHTAADYWESKHFDGR
jgi:hypothetical protein